MVKERSQSPATLAAMPNSKPSPWALLPLLILSCVEGAVADEADAFNFFAGANVTHDSNIFRLDDAVDARTRIGTDKRSDTVRNAYVGGTFDKLVGRQRLRVDATANSVTYERFSMLDYNGGNVQGSLNWAITDYLSGTLGKSRNRSQTGFGDIRTTVQNLNTIDAEFASFDLWMPTLSSWHLEGNLRHATTLNSSALYQASDSTVDTRSAGVRYAPASAKFYIRLRKTHSDGDYPNRQLVPGATVDNSYHQDETAFEASWQVSGASRLSGTLAHTQRQHDNVPERDFSGATGNFTWDWALTGKTAIATRFNREIGAQEDALSSYVVTEGWSVKPTWMPTAKTQFSLQLEHKHRDFLGDPIAAFSMQAKRRDKIDIAGLSASYQPFRSVLVSFSFSKEKRDSNYFGLSYDDRIVALNAQIGF